MSDTLEFVETPRGPGGPFTCLFDETRGDASTSLPLEFRTIYSGDWHIPGRAERPFTYSNFALSRDGRVSYNIPGFMSGADVSGFNRHDAWLMALLRSRADAVIMGDNTLRTEPEHLWTAEYIFPEDAEAFAALRKVEGLRRYPLTVFLSFTGEFDPLAPVFCHSDMHIVIATTQRGYENAQPLRNCAANVEVLELGAGEVNLSELMRILFQTYGVRRLLCEGGPRAYASMLHAKLIDEEFLALCPNVVGSSIDAPRPGLIEGTAFHPERAPRSKPISLRRAGDHLFLRSKYLYP